MKGDNGYDLGDVKQEVLLQLQRLRRQCYKRRIMDMGITKGSQLYIRKVCTAW